MPPWSGDDGLYREAFARLEAPAPAYDPTFLHRDFHPGNVLWHDGVVSGVVDWVETSTGPADLDVAHCASNLAGLHGVATALAFRRSYVDQGGRLAQDAEPRRTGSCSTSSRSCRPPTAGRAAPRPRCCPRCGRHTTGAT